MDNSDGYSPYTPPICPDCREPAGCVCPPDPLTCPICQSEFNGDDADDDYREHMEYNHRCDDCDEIIHSERIPCTRNLGEQSTRRIRCLDHCDVTEIAYEVQRIIETNVAGIDENDAIIQAVKRLQDAYYTLEKKGGIKMKTNTEIDETTRDAAVAWAVARAALVAALVAEDVAWDAQATETARAATRAVQDAETALAAAQAAEDVAEDAKTKGEK